MSVRHSFASILLVAALVGCPGTTTMTDAGTGGTDTGGFVPPDLVPLTNGTTADPTREPANYACNGTRVEPTATGTGPIDFHLVGFGSGDAVANARIFFFADNIPSPTCAAPNCVEAMTDATGHATVTGPLGGWYGYRVFERSGPTMASTYVDSLQINETGAAEVEGNAVSVSTLGLIPAAFGFVRVPTTAIVAGEISDCDGDQVRGAIVRLFDDAGNEFISDPETNDAPHIQYFDGNENPDGNTTFSQVDGLYAAANITGPTDDGFIPVRAEAYGIMSAGAPVELIGCEEVGVFMDGVSIVNLGPLRSDYPTDHSCNGR